MTSPGDTLYAKPGVLPWRLQAGWPHGDREGRECGLRSYGTSLIGRPRRAAQKRRVAAVKGSIAEALVYPAAKAQRAICPESAAASRRTKPAQRRETVRLTRRYSTPLDYESGALLGSWPLTGTRGHAGPALGGTALAGAVGSLAGSAGISAPRLRSKVGCLVGNPVCHGLNRRFVVAE